jgi:hypothetical protein
MKMHEESTNEITNAESRASEQSNTTDIHPDAAPPTPGDEVTEYTIFPTRVIGQEGAPLDPEHWAELLELVSDLFDEGSSVRLRDDDGDYDESVDRHLTRIGCRVGIRNHCVT